MQTNGGEMKRKGGRREKEVSGHYLPKPHSQPLQSQEGLVC